MFDRVLDHPPARPLGPASIAAFVVDPSHPAARVTGGEPAGGHDLSTPAPGPRPRVRTARSAVARLILDLSHLGFRGVTALPAPSRPASWPTTTSARCFARSAASTAPSSTSSAGTARARPLAPGGSAARSKRRVW